MSPTMLPDTGFDPPQLGLAKKVTEIIEKSRISVDFSGVFCYNFTIARYCVQAFDTPGRPGVRPAGAVRGIVTEPLSRGSTTRRSCLKRMWPEGR